jgi:hypothetical protein
MKTRTRLTTDQKMSALAFIARGDTLSQVAGHLFEDYNVTVSESALSQIKKHHADTIEKMRESLVDATSSEAAALANRARRMLNKKLDKADRDANALEEIDQKYRDGEIKDIEEYRRRKAGLLQVSIQELNHISRSMHAQSAPETPPPSGAPALPPGSNAQLSTPAHLEALLRAIAAGNTVEIQRLVFTPGVSKNVEPITVQS